MSNPNRDTIDQIFRRMANCPEGLDATNSQVLAGCGLLVAVILRECYADPLGEAERFAANLRACLDPALRAKLMQSRQPLN
jgi:hypothetical protein